MDEVKLVAEYEAAWKKVASSPAAIQSTLGMRRNAEQNFGAAYQRLVRVGLRPQIRGKYRGD